MYIAGLISAVQRMDRCMIDIDHMASMHPYARAYMYVYLCIRSAVDSLTLSHGEEIRVWGNAAIEVITFYVTLGSLFKFKVELIDLVT